MKPLARGMLPQHTSLILVLMWIVTSIFAGQSHVGPPCCTAMRLPAANAVARCVVHRSKSVRAPPSVTCSEKNIYHGAPPPPAGYTVHSGNYFHQKGAWFHSAGAAPPQHHQDLLCLGNSIGHSAAVPCSRCFVDVSTQCDAPAHADDSRATPAFSSSSESSYSGTMSPTPLDCATACAVNLENAFPFQTSGAASAIDDQLLQQRMKAAARIYACPALSEALRLHNRKRAWRYTHHRQPHRNAPHTQQGSQHTDESNSQSPHFRLLPGQPTEKRQSGAEERWQQHDQPAQQRQGNSIMAGIHRGSDGLEQESQRQQQSEPVVIGVHRGSEWDKPSPLQHRSSCQDLRKLRSYGTAVEVDKDVENQHGHVVEWPSGLPVPQAEAKQGTSVRGGALGARDDSDDVGEDVKNDRACRTAATPPSVRIDQTGVPHESSMGSCTGPCSRPGVSTRSGCGLVSSMRDSSTSTTFEIHGESVVGGGFTQHGRRMMVPLACPTGRILRQLRRYSCSRTSALLRLRKSLFGSVSRSTSNSVVAANSQREDTWAGDGGTTNAEGNKVIRLRHCACGNCSARTPDDPAGAERQNRQGTQSMRRGGAAANVQRLLDASLVVARVVRCRACTARLHSASGRRGMNYIDDGLGNSCKTPRSVHVAVDVWHVLPASGFFVHSSGILVTSFHVISPSAARYQQVHHQQRRVTAAAPQQHERRLSDNHLELQQQIPQNLQTLPQHSCSRCERSSQRQQQQIRRGQHPSVHCSRRRQEVKHEGSDESAAAASFSTSPVPVPIPKDDEELYGEDMTHTEEVLVVMDRKSRCWPVKRILAASASQDLALLEIDWEGLLRPHDLVETAATPSAQATTAAVSAPASSPSAVTRTAEALTSEEGFGTALEPGLHDGQGTASQWQQGKQQEEKKEHLGEQQQDSGQVPHGAKQRKGLQQGDSERHRSGGGDGASREPRAGHDAMDEDCKCFQRQWDGTTRRVPWLQIEKSGTLPGRPVLVCSNPSGRFFTITDGLTVTADFAQGSSGGAVIDTVTGRVVGVAQSTSSLHGNTSAGNLGTTQVSHKKSSLHPQLQMVIKTCVPIESLALIIDEALEQQQARSPLCASDSCTSRRPAAAAAAAA